MAEKLNALKVSRIKKPGRYGDGLGLWLQVSPQKTKSWCFRFTLNGRARWMGLGPVHSVTLADAREAARDARRLLLAGIDPIDARAARKMQARLEAARGISFKECATAYIAAHEAGWSSATHRKQWPATLQSYVYPLIGDLAVAEVDTAMVLRVLEPIWLAKTSTASRVRGRIAAVLDWASAREYRTGANPARWQGHLDKLLPARTKIARVRHHPALAYGDISAFMSELRSRGGIAARALEVAILTATRTSETVRAKWSEINMREAVWTIPAERMKGGREHRVPLSDRVIKILGALPREADWIFPGAKKGVPISKMALLNVLKGMGRASVTVHGFRATFRDWTSETTGYSAHVAEMALAHAVSDQVEAAYRRGDLFEKRRRLMADWAKYCAAPPRDGQVVPMRAS